MLDRYEELYLKARASGEKPGTATIIMNDTNKDDGNILRNMTSASVVNSKDGNQYVFFVNTVLSPVQSTVSTLQVQYVCYCCNHRCNGNGIGILLFLKKLDLPIRTTNEQAKQLALGNYDVHFANHEYVEMPELNETLNYATKRAEKGRRLA